MKLLFISLGCDKNLVDTEKMLGVLQEKGYTFTDDDREAEVIVINTCCFIGDAKEESINTILEMAKRKEDGCCKVLLVTGCLAQRYQDEVLEEIPEVDGILGTSSLEAVAQMVEETLKGKKFKQFELADTAQSTPRVVTTGGHYSYLKIAEGCDKACTYCIIPKIRGAYHSVPIEKLVEEAKQLADAGVKELILVAQETTLYGVDLYGEKKLPELLRQLAAIPDIKWIRLLYCYPEEITTELLQTIKEEPKVLNYLDIPIQHASDGILKRMGRKTSRKQIEEKVLQIRSMIPNVAIRTTLIAGFPGETESDHREVVQFVDKMRFDRLGVFAYSQEEDTPAAAMEGQIPESQKEAWRDELMKLQQSIAFEKSEAMVGSALDVLIEGEIVDEDAFVGRTYMDAPGVDGYLFVQTDRQLMTGDIVKVRVIKAADYDLIGELYNELTE